MSMAENDANSNPSSAHHTYVAGEDEGRLEQAAQDLGLDRGRGTTVMASWADLLFRDGTATAARMHSVGAIGTDERIDNYGTLHLMTTRRRKKIESTMPEYREEGSEEEEDEVIDMVEGGSLDAAVFGIVKATVGKFVHCTSSYGVGYL